MASFRFLEEDSGSGDRNRVGSLRTEDVHRILTLNLSRRQIPIPICSFEMANDDSFALIFLYIFLCCNTQLLGNCIARFRKRGIYQTGQFQ